MLRGGRGLRMVVIFHVRRLTDGMRRGSLRDVKQKHNKNWLDLVIELMATGIYLGRSPFAPGTFGTLLGIPLAYGFFFLGPYFYMLATLLLVFFAVWVAERYEKTNHRHDPGEVVIDEVVGYLISFLWLPMTWQSFVGAFLFFRLFDIWKPVPVRTVDQKIPGGFGTVMDDVAAGLLANFCLQIIYTQTSWLGAQLHGF